MIPIEAFFVGPRQTVRRNDEILTEIFVPDAQARFGAAYARFGLREANSVAVAGVAAGIALREDGKVGEARICLPGRSFHAEDRGSRGKSTGGRDLGRS